MDETSVKDILELLLTQLDEIESLRLDHKRPVKFDAEFFDEMLTNGEHIYTLKWSYKEDMNIEESLKRCMK